MLHDMHLMLLNIRVHHMIAKKERRQQKYFKVTQQPEKGMQ